MKLRDMKKSCGRLLLLSLSIVSSIQQGGASEPGVQPGQAGGLCKAWWGGGGGGEDDAEDGGCMCDGGMLGSRCLIYCTSLRVLIHVSAMSESREMKVLLQSVDKAMQELDGQG